MPRGSNLTILIFIFLVTGSRCESDDYLYNPVNLYSSTNEGSSFSIKFSNNIEYDKSMIDYYDISSHIIYLKEGYTFTCHEGDTFTVNINDEIVYSGRIDMAYSSLFSEGPVINCPTFYPENVIPIGLNRIINSGEELMSSANDFRSNKRIIEALKSDGLCRYGLSARIIDVRKNLSDGLTLKIRLTNKEDGDLYYLDPEKIGAEGFHYFTDGLVLTDSRFNSYSNKITTMIPSSTSNWRSDWLSVLKSGESKTVTIGYADFDTIPVGRYFASFTFPGTGHPEKGGDIRYGAGRIWLGEMAISGIVQID